MFPEKKTKKLLPCGSTKAKIFQMYPSESDKYLRNLIHSIQVENNPHLPEAKVKNRQRLSRKEVEQIVDVMGAPKGYENRFDD